MDKITKSKDGYQNFKGVPFRPGQLEAVDFFNTSTKKLLVVIAPCGAGKSLLGMVTGGCYNRFCYLVSSKPLQDQITTDFPEAMSMKGRSNYPCVQSRRYTAAECTHVATDPCIKKPVCPYEVQKKKVIQHDKQILNYSYMLIEANHVGRFSGYPVIIADEGDTLESHLSSQVSLNFSIRRMRELGIPAPKYKSFTAAGALPAWQNWTRDALVAVEHRGNLLQDRLGDTAKGSDENIRIIREMSILGGLRSKMGALRQYMDDTWLVDIKKRGTDVLSWDIKPTWLSRDLTEQWFFRHADRVMMMSATFPARDVLAELLGLSSGDIDVIEIPSSFPVANRPVKLLYAADLRTQKGGAGIDPGELERAMKAIREILKRHPGEKGLIHTVNWNLNAMAVQAAGERAVTHEPMNKHEQLEKFFAMPPSTGAVFISPSSTRGIDCHGDRARFNIILKCPYPYLGDKLVAARVYGKRGIGEYWYRSVTACDIVQAAGRVVRSRDDWGVTYIIDTQACKLITSMQGLFPQYFLESLDIA